MRTPARSARGWPSASAWTTSRLRPRSRRASGKRSRRASSGCSGAASSSARSIPWRRRSTRTPSPTSRSCEARREDLEVALRELQTLIRDTDKRIREAFDETFAAAATNFEEVVGRLFPGGRGRLRLVREDAGPRPVLGGGAAGEEGLEGDAAAGADPDGSGGVAAGTDAAGAGPDVPGVEIEITPAGKATKRLSLLSGGEKSLTALAFLFAVFLARPCPFYILDEVEAALDDLNIDRVLALLRGFADRAQFIVVTHQKRTMEAADCLYGVSMAADGVSRVVSRRLPPRAIAAA